MCTWKTSRLVRGKSWRPWTWGKKRPTKLFSSTVTKSVIVVCLLRPRFWSAFRKTCWDVLLWTNWALCSASGLALILHRHFLRLMTSLWCTVLMESSWCWTLQRFHTTAAGLFIWTTEENVEHKKCERRPVKLHDCHGPHLHTAGCKSDGLLAVSTLARTGL